MTTIEAAHAERIARFPFPFREDAYRYSTNVEPAYLYTPTEAGGWGDRMLDIDADYHAELALKATILARDRSRSLSQPHMQAACWDMMLTLMNELAVSYPDSMQLSVDDGIWTWRNDLLGLRQTFVVGVPDSLPEDPLTYLGSQLQEDIVLLDHRADDLWADAGFVTFAADWSLSFDLGMRFLDIHGPVPRIHEEGVIGRAHQFLLRLTPEQSFRRTNWSMTAGPRLDTATEVYPEWGPERASVGTRNGTELAELLHLRVEVQHLRRLGESGAILFLIRTYLLSLADIATVAPWRHRLGKVLRDLPSDMADYKGLTNFRSAAADWLLNAAPEPAAPSHAVPEPAAPNHAEPNQPGPKHAGNTDGSTVGGRKLTGRNGAKS